jgi:hypothetical protein
MYVHTILPVNKSTIQIPPELVQNEMIMKTGKRFLGTIFYCPQNPIGFNCFDPEIPGSRTALIRQILSITNDFVLLYTTDDYPTILDYSEMANFEGIDRVFIVHSGESHPPIHKDFQLDAYIFERYFQKEEPPAKKRWLLSVDVEEKVHDSPSKKQNIEQPSSDIPVISPSEGSRTPTHPSNFWEEKDITKIAWTEEIFPDYTEKLQAYKIHGISEIKYTTVPVTSKSPMICSYPNGRIYMNQKTMIQKSDFKKISELIASKPGRKVYAFNKIVGYYETDRMVYHHY